MDGPSVAQIADHRHVQPVDVAQLCPNGVQIQQRLGGVLSDAIAGVDDRLARVLGSDLGGSYVGMAEHDDVGVRLQRADGVGQALTLGHR